MQRLEYKIETTVFVKYHKTGAVNNHSIVFIFA